MTSYSLRMEHKGSANLWVQSVGSLHRVSKWNVKYCLSLRHSNHQKLVRKSKFRQTIVVLILEVPDNDHWKLDKILINFCLNQFFWFSFVSDGKKCFWSDLCPVFFPCCSKRSFLSVIKESSPLVKKSKRSLFGSYFRVVHCEFFFENWAAKWHSLK